MVFAHIFGIPVEETAIAFVPLVAIFIAGVRAYGHEAHRTPPRSAGYKKQTSHRRVAQSHRQRTSRRTPA
jgi:hypothetical protein